MTNDFLSALRSLALARRFTASAVLLLALAVALLVAAITVGQEDLYRTRALRDPASLVRIDQSREATRSQPLSLQRFARYRSTAKTLADLAGGESDSVNLNLDGDPVGVVVGRVTPNFFALLGVRFELGRSFLPEEARPGRDRVAVLTHRIWQGQFFNGDRGVLGRTILLNDASYVVVGVLPANFDDSFVGGGSLYIPREWPVESLASENLFKGLGTIGRMAPGYDIEQVRAELATIQPEVGSPFEKHFVTVQSAITLLGESSSNAMPLVQGIRSSYRVIVGATTALFAIALVNVGALFLLRAVSRRREVSVRSALGASPRSLFVRFAMEGLLLGSAGSGLGLVGARWLLVLLGKAAPNISVGEVVEFGPAALAVAAAQPLVTALLSGGVPLLVNHRNPLGGLREGGGRFSAGQTVARLRAAIVTLEVGLAAILLVGAGLLIRTTWRLAAVEVGFDPAAKVSVTLSEPILSGRKASAERLQIRQRIAEAIAAVPGVERVALSSAVIPGSLDLPRPFSLPGRPEITDAAADGVGVSPEYFATLGLVLKSGRPFEAGARLGAPLAVINEAMARRYFPEQDPLGQQLQVGRDRLEIVGVVSDARTLREPAAPRYYRPVSDATLGRVNLLVGVRGRPTADLGARIRRAAYEAEPTYVVRSVRTLEDLVERQMGNERGVLVVLGCLAVGAVVLCLAGIFANMAYAIAQRRTEFGVRLALGATPGAIYRGVFRQGLGLVAAGTGPGLLAAGFLGALIRSLLYGTAPIDWAVYAATALGLQLVAFLALWLPARTAARTEIAGLLKADG